MSQIRSLYRRLLRELPSREAPKTVLSHPSILQLQIRSHISSSVSSEPSSSSSSSPPGSVSATSTSPSSTTTIPTPRSALSKANLADATSTSSKIASAVSAGKSILSSTAKAIGVEQNEQAKTNPSSSSSSSTTQTETGAEAREGDAAEVDRKTAELEQFVLYVRAQRMYATLLERYNPGMNMDEEERVRLSARRVGMNLPVEWEKS